jgi:hypothetical protein
VFSAYECDGTVRKILRFALSVTLGLGLLLPASVSAATAHPDVIKTTVSGSSVTVSWGPIPSDLGYTNGMYEAFLGKRGFHNDGSPGDYKATCRTAPTASTCTLKNIPAGSWDVVVYATSTNNKSYPSKVVSIRVGKAPLAPAVGVACESKGEVTQVKGRYLECGAKKKWRLVLITAPCLKVGSKTDTHLCSLTDSTKRWIRIPSELGAIERPSCAKHATTQSNFISCAREVESQPVAKKVNFSFVVDPGIHKSVITKANDLALWTVPIFQSVLNQVPFVPKVTIIISLSYKWCVEKALPLFLERSTPPPTQSERLVYCETGGANGGHSIAPQNGVILLRIPPELTSDFRIGTRAALNSFELNAVMTSEIGHTMRGFLTEALIPGCGTACNAGDKFPNWAAYLGNSVVGYLGMLNAGRTEEQVELLLLWQGNPEATWKPRYSDPRLKCSGDPAKFAGVYPNNYGMQYAAAQYLVGSFGVDWLFQSLFPALIRSDCVLDEVAGSLWDGDWSDLEAELDEYLLSQLVRAGINVPD